MTTSKRLPVARGLVSAMCLLGATAAEAGCLDGDKASPPAPGARRAEIQINLCPAEGGLPALVSALGFAPEPTGTMAVWLYDDADRSLFKVHGVRLRLRIPAKVEKAELTLKLGNQDCARAEPDLAADEDYKCEYDMHGAALPALGTVSFTRRNVPAKLVSAPQAADSAVLAGALSPGQIKLLTERVPGVLPLSPAVKAQPQRQLDSYKNKKTHGPGLGVSWPVPKAGEPRVEYEFKVDSSLAAACRVDMVNLLKRKNLNLCADQGTPTSSR